ncbi:hypothetical protein PQX77_006645 [Marasmius sp. AFHP31]|nr:hypothetical protein PQX77_006645 [Marasmius sp. AFHP31]
MSRPLSPASNNSDSVLVSIPDQKKHDTSPTTLQPNGPVEKASDSASPDSPKAVAGEGSHPVDYGGWGKGGSTWGTSWDTGKSGTNTYNVSERPQKITLLSIRDNGWGDDQSRFLWCSAVSSDQHVTHFTRRDLDTTFLPSGLERPSVLDDVATPEWARTQLIKSLHEAQESGIPGLAFTLSQVTRRWADVQAKVTQLESELSEHNDKVNDIRAKQSQLQDEASHLDDVIYGMRDRTTELETAVRDLLEVEKDLKDLQAITLAYC